MSELRDEIERWIGTFSLRLSSRLPLTEIELDECPELAELPGRLERLLRRLDRFAVGSVGSGVRQPQDQRILAALRDDLREAG